MLHFTNDGEHVRPFTTLDEMHHTIIRNWNSVVTPADKVYHLGDVTFQYNGLFSEIMSQLNGHKRLLVGNHDKLQNPNLFRWFDKVDLWRGFRDGNFTCSHIPLRLDSLRDGAFNVHGHTHERVLTDPHYINVCVEQTDYTPVSMDWIKSTIQQRLTLC
jgi:calcineurin-like phosphoesterase family protein